MQITNIIVILSKLIHNEKKLFILVIFKFDDWHRAHKEHVASISGPEGKLYKVAVA